MWCLGTCLNSHVRLKVAAHGGCLENKDEANLGIRLQSPLVELMYGVLVAIPTGSSDKLIDHLC
jgi:hypothetical protein